MNPPPIHAQAAIDPRTGQRLAPAHAHAPSPYASPSRSGLSTGEVVLIAGVAAVLGFLVGAITGGVVGFSLGAATGAGLNLQTAGKAPTDITAAFVAPASVKVNEPFDATITITASPQRTGPITLTEIDLMGDALANLTLLSATPTPPRQSGTTADNELTLGFDRALAPGQSHTVTLRMVATAPGPVTLDADAWFEGWALITSTVTIDVIEPPR